MKDSFQIFPVGILIKQNENSVIKIYDKYIQRSTKLTQQHLNFLKYNKIALQVILNRRCAFR